MICQRCTKNVSPEGIHTCTPTDGWRALEARIRELEAELESHKSTNAAMEADLRTQAAVRGEKQLEGKLTAVMRWLEANQPDVFKRVPWNDWFGVLPEPTFERGDER